jgi:hypothetical protein
MKTCKKCLEPIGNKSIGPFCKKCADETIENIKTKDWGPYPTRLRLGLNQVQMSKAMGCHYNTWWKWEAHEQAMDASKKRMLKLLLILQVKGMLDWYLDLFECK